MGLHLSEADRAFVNDLASKIANEFCAARGLPEVDGAALGAKINDAVTVCVETKLGIVRRYAKTHQLDRLVYADL